MADKKASKAHSKGTKVLIVMGSDSDLPVMRASAETLDAFGVSYDIEVASAHRSPERVQRLVRAAEKKGARIIVAGAGMAAHLAGAVASHTTLPVIGVPINASPLQGLDSLLSTLQMPPGIPVATMAVGKAGAKNAAVLAVQIMSLSDPALARKLKAYRKDMAAGVAEKSRAMKKKL